MKPNAENREDPDQMFFEFAAPLPVSVLGQSVLSASGQPQSAKPSRVGGGRDSAAVHRPAHVQPSRYELNAAVLKPAPAPVSAEYITEARAAALIEQAARELRNGEMRRARIVFRPFRSTLYSFKISKSGVATVKFHIAFRRASPEVILQAARLMLCRRSSDRAAIDRTDYNAFVRSLAPAEFELPGARKGRRQAVGGPGAVHSLEESFERVNGEYFQSKLAKPDLCWSPVRARRMLGSYHERNDRLIISRLFDSRKVPQYVLDYLMYHELLHKFLGIGTRSDGKRCMHGPEFRLIEQRFRRYAEATAFLAAL
jgi:hypothetical protein